MPENGYVANAGAVEILARHGLVVSPKTVSRWGKDGKLPFVRTLGGHRRYRVADLEEIAKAARFTPEVAE
jgi:excisionase family DNA binding protein